MNQKNILLGEMVAVYNCEDVDCFLPFAQFWVPDYGLAPQLLGSAFSLQSTESKIQITDIPRVLCGLWDFLSYSQSKGQVSNTANGDYYFRTTAWKLFSLEKCPFNKELCSCFICTLEIFILASVCHCFCW